MPINRQEGAHALPLVSPTHFSHGAAHTCLPSEKLQAEGPPGGVAPVVGMVWHGQYRPLSFKMKQTKTHTHFYMSLNDKNILYLLTIFTFHLELRWKSSGNQHLLAGLILLVYVWTEDHSVVPHSYLDFKVRAKQNADGETFLARALRLLLYIYYIFIQSNLAQMTRSCIEIWILYFAAVF